jgi:Skp family chaperone for outer membrane proteins
LLCYTLANPTSICLLSSSANNHIDDIIGYNISICTLSATTQQQLALPLHTLVNPHNNSATNISTMGKGSNVQKAQAARERNQKKLGKSDEERKAATAKAKLDASAYICKICRQTFMVNAKSSLLYLHVTAKHDNKADTPSECFDSLVGYDPNDPDGEKAAAAAKAAGPVKPKKSAKKDDDLLGLLDAGLKKGKK